MSVLARRLHAQLLADGKADAPLPVVERLLAIQAQDARGARLAIRARSAGLTAADVDAALTADRSLVITWLNRGTLHLVRSEDYPWLQQLTAPQLQTGTARRLSQEGVTPEAAERGVAAIEHALAEEGPLDRDRLRERVAAASVRTQGQAFVHLLALASIRGLIVRGPVLDGREAFVLARDWLGEPRPVDRDRALAELARRYLSGHGPATPADLARWAGLPLRDVRAGLQAISSELRRDEGDLVDLKGRTTTSRFPDPQLLGSFEPILLGWTNRDAILGEDAARVVSGGVFRAFALVRGRGAATWTISRGTAKLEPFRPLSSTDRAALEIDAADVIRFLQVQVNPAPAP